MKKISLVLIFLILSAAPAAADTYVVGDSLTDQTYESGGWYVDAIPGMSLHQSHWRIRRAMNNAPTALVVALGSNDTAQGSRFIEQDIQKVMNRNAPCTVITTVKVHGVTSYYGLRWARLATRWNRAVRNSGAVVANWNTTSKGHPDWFLADGLHLTDSGEVAYDQMLRAAVSACP